MSKSAAILALAITLAACDMFNALTEGRRLAEAVQADLQSSIGMKPEVGFKWSNGRLQNVTVTFPELYTAKPLAEVAEVVRLAVLRGFKRTPDDIVVGFSLGKSGGPRTAQFHAAF